MTQFTDMFDNPINIGSVVTYTTLRYKSAHQGFAVVEEFVELIEKPSGGQWHSTGPRSQIPYIRKDQKPERATEFYVEVDPQGRPRPDKLYIAKTRELHRKGDDNKAFLAYAGVRLGNRRAGELIVLDALGVTVTLPEDLV